MRPMRRCRQQGVTLLETMITLTIVGILVSVAVLLYVGQVPQARLNGAARQVMSDLMLARRQAVSRSQQVRVYFPDDQQYKICYDANGDGMVTDCEGNAAAKDIQATYDGVTISANQNPVFHPRGTVSPMATITVKNATGSRDITISSAGRIRIKPK
jgi:type IV fimbrial biogenesis protein FimT